jgi:hypothetical protein
MEVSPTIFDRMLGFSHMPGLPRPKELRYYACEERKGVDGNAQVFHCRLGTLDQVVAAKIAGEHGTPFRHVQAVNVAAACPSWNDQLVLGRKLGATVTLGKSLGN